MRSGCVFADLGDSLKGLKLKEGALPQSSKNGRLSKDMHWCENDGGIQWHGTPVVFKDMEALQGLRVNLANSF